MKKIALLLLIAAAFFTSATAQVRQGKRLNDDSKGRTVKEWAIDSLLRFPRDTLKLLVTDSNSFAYKGGKLWTFTGYKWVLAADTSAGGGGGNGEVVKPGYALSKYLDSLSVDTTVIATVQALNRAIDTLQNDSTTFFIDTAGLKLAGGVLTNNRPYKVVQSIAEMRASPEIKDSWTVYRMKRDGIQLDYTQDFADNTSPDDGVTVIINNGKRYKVYFETYILANWWPTVKPDDNVDDTPGLQAAWDFAARNTKTPMVKILGGVYNVSNLVLYKPHPTQAGEYFFFSGGIEGASPSAGAGIGATTTFKNTNKNAFTIGVELGRNVFIRNIGGEGTVPYVQTGTDFIEWTDAQWTDNNTIRNNRFSPGSTFIVTDPFYFNVASENQYPGMASWYSNHNFEGTSSMTIDGCEARRFICAVLISANGTSQNGDNIRWTNGVAYNNKNFWASCQTQTRANSITNLYSYGATQMLVNCKEYGYQQGTPPRFDNLNAAGGHKYLYNYDGAFGSISFTGGYAEYLYSIGKSGELPADFTNFDISFRVPEGAQRVSPIIAQGTQINFKGGSIQWFDDIYTQAMAFNVGALTIDGTEISGGLPFITNSYFRDRVSFKNVYYRNTEGYSHLSENLNVSETVTSLFNNRQILTGSKLKTQGFNITYEAVGNKYDLTLMESNANIRVVNNLAYFISSNSARWQINDPITTYDQNIDYANDIYSNAAGTLGWVYAKSGDTVKIKYIPYGLADNSSYNLYISRIPKFITRTFGTFASGSTTITGTFSGSDGTFEVGGFIKGAGIPNGTRVTAKSGNTFTISLPTTAAGTNVELYDAKIKASVTNDKVLGTNNSALDFDTYWFKGDTWTNVLGGEPYGGYFTQGGVRNNFGATYSTIQPADVSSLVNISGDQSITGLKQFTNFYGSWFGTEFSTYDATGLIIRKSANNNGYNEIQSYARKNVNGSEAGDAGNLILNRLGGNVGIGQLATGYKLSVAGLISGREVISVELPSAITKKANMGIYDPGTGAYSYIQAYDFTNNVYLPFQFEGSTIKLKPNAGTAGSLEVNTSGLKFNDFVGGGEKMLKVGNDGQTVASNMWPDGTVNNLTVNGSTNYNRNDNDWAIYIALNGKIHAGGFAEFMKTVTFDSLKTGVAGKAMATIDLLTGKLGTSAIPAGITYTQQIASGSTLTVNNSGNSSYYFNPPSVLSSYTITIPTMPANSLVYITFGGTINNGSQVITSLSVVAGSGATLVQTTAPTTANAGDALIYFTPNGTLFYRLK